MARKLSNFAREPHLLVSVRNIVEARAALAGGCDVLDVKAPERGSLGMAVAEEIERIVCETMAVRRQGPDPIPVSAALGEAREWLDLQLPPPALPHGLTYLKLGT